MNSVSLSSLVEESRSNKKRKCKK